MRRRRQITKSEVRGAEPDNVPLWRKIRIHWWFTILLFTAILVWLSLPTRHQPIDISRFKIGEPSPEDVISPVEFSYVDPNKTASKRKSVELSSPIVVDVDTKSQRDDLNQLIETIFRIREMEIGRQEKINRMTSELIIGDYLSPDVKAALVDLEDDEIEDIRAVSSAIIDKVLDRGVVSSEFLNSLPDILGSERWAKAKSDLERELGREPSDSEVVESITVMTSGSGDRRKISDFLRWSDAVSLVQQEVNELKGYENHMIVGQIAENLIRSNVSYNEAITKAKREEALKSVGEVHGTVARGERIISAGEVVDAVDMSKLTSLAMTASEHPTRMIIGVSLLVVSFMLILAYYVSKFESEVYDEYGKILTLCLSVALIIGVGKLIIRYGSGSLPMPELLTPTAMASAITAVLVSPQLAMLVTVLMGVLMSMITGQEIGTAIGYFSLVFVGGMVAIYALSRLRHRRDLIVAGFYVAITNVVLVFAFSLIGGNSLSVSGINVLSGLASGLTVAFLMPGLLPFFEYIAQTTTEIELLELSDMNNPLLTRLEENARGTYYHSINVAKLAEAAAEEINANSLLVRVGAYYHDIGKMRHPLYFIENQNGENIHDTLAPAMSARIIIAHTKDGVDMAKREKLPKVIQNIIQQHHGTSLVLYFYHKAAQMDKSINDEDFRYPGPKPQTKEAAIIMLADSVESAVRSTFVKGNPNYDEVRDLIQKVIAQKVEDQQFDECNLTLKDIRSIADAFIRVTVGMFHERIEYPELEVKEDEVIPLDYARRRRESRK